MTSRACMMKMMMIMMIMMIMMMIMIGSSGVSPASSIPGINEILVTDTDTGHTCRHVTTGHTDSGHHTFPEISIHVPDLREAAKLGSRSVTSTYLLST